MLTGTAIDVVVAWAAGEEIEVAGATEGGVVPGAAVEPIAAVAVLEHVVAGFAEEGIVAAASVEMAGAACAVDRVIASFAADRGGL